MTTITVAMCNYYCIRHNSSNNSDVVCVCVCVRVCVCVCVCVVCVCACVQLVMPPVTDENVNFYRTYLLQSRNALALHQLQLIISCNNQLQLIISCNQLKLIIS